MNKYRKIYNICYSCKAPKAPTSYNKCSKCLKKSRLEHRMSKIKPTGYENEIVDFVNKIVDNKLWVTLEDINSIITYYTMITDRIYEYDLLKSGTQVNKMFERLMAFSIKNKK